ncbi:hypothetical protein DPV78_003386 [Talaromyces pinophilus]|nr:hypothetical protein DPV78_003386 [Talaromyces pinophilus]
MDVFSSPLQTKNKPYVLRRFDVDILVLPMKYLEEICLMSTSELSSKSAQAGGSLNKTLLVTPVH